MDVTLFLVRALSTKMYENDITVLFDNHALEAYQAAQKSPFWNSIAIRELPPEDEIRARKILGLVCLSMENNGIQDELTTIFFSKIGLLLKRYIVKEDTQAYYDLHIEEMRQQVNALPQRVVDYVLILLGDNGIDKEDTLSYVYELLQHWERKGDVFSSLTEKDKTLALKLLKEYFPERKYTNYMELIKFLYKQKGLSKGDISAFQYIFLSEQISVEEYGQQVDIKKDDLRQLFAIAVRNKLSNRMLPYFILSGIESMIVAKSYNKLRNGLLKSDLELVEIKHQVQISNEQKMRRENQLLQQENKKFQERIKFLEGEQHTWNKEELKSREETISILEQLLDSKVNELEEATKKDSVKEADTPVVVNLECLKIAVVGGYPKLNADLKKEIPNLSIFSTVDRLNKSLQQFDFVFLSTSYASHAMKMKLDSMKIDYLYLASMTAARLVNEIKTLIQLKQI
ncbi:hypothetical protein [Listeria marthii]|uniref:hypothetical protein n=1 Tax=Listeria marthii TaxID=529731 RepID=UPI001E34234B|nr:hypothetical protein [Listeria marthii]MCD2255024.1 hypothetical protein [Listeria marthii]